MRLRLTLLTTFALSGPIGVHGTLAAPVGVENPLPRFPNAGANGIVFSARGHIWLVANSGGAAQQLTFGQGYDIAPRYSPDGHWIAFTGNREGAQDVYVIPSAGGAPRRLTTLAAAPPSNGVRRSSSEGLVIAWTPDSRAVVYLSRRLARSSWLYRPFTVALDGGLPTPLPVDRSGYLSFGPDGRRFAFTRTFTEFRTWKRYDGGLAEDVEVYDPTTRDLQRITDWKGSNGIPMWAGRRIYFVSDRDAYRRANIWVYELDTRQTRQVTHFTDYDVDVPSYGAGQITFQQGGKLWTLDISTELLRAVPFSVTDDEERTRPRVVDVKALVHDTDTAYAVDYSVSPMGELAAFSARGDIFLAPTGEDGVPRNLTATSNAEEDHPAFSPDGRLIAYTTDASGEQQVVVRPVAGGPERQVTHFATGYLYTPLWSPDGRWMAVPDGAHKLWLVSAGGTGEPKLVGYNRNHFMHEVDEHDAAFSPDSRWLAYSLARPNRMRELHLYAVESDRDVVLSAPDESDYRPAFSPDGKYLYFVSDRHAISVQSDRETNTVQVKSQGFYVAALAIDTPPRFQPKEQEPASAPSVVTGGALPPKPGERRPQDRYPLTVQTQAVSATEPLMRVDLAGLMQRAVPAPIAPAKIVSLEVREDAVFYATEPPDTLSGSLPGETPALHRLDVATGRDHVIVEGADSHVVSADGRRVVYKRGDEWFAAAVVDQAQATKLPLDRLHALVDPQQEWREMFDNVWRLERDMFVNADMNGDDWTAVHAAYAKLLRQVATRDDLNYLIGEMIGELASSHTYVGGGDDGELQTGAPMNYLGADYAPDRASNRYRFAKIYAGDSSRDAYRGPLGWPGVDVHAGDYLLAIDRHELTAPDTPDAMLAHAGSRVELTLAATADGPRRTMTVTPLKDETALRRLEWERHEAALADRLSGGRVGYIHLDDMLNLGMEEFVYGFYSQLGKEALVIDDRFNQGGNTDEIVLERLRRTLSSMQTLRDRSPETQPDQVQIGPKAMLINHFSASDGDVFPFHFRAYGLGPLVGTRTWGGVRGIAWFWPLLDGGYVTIPQITFYDRRGHWVVENHGNDPDVEVEDRPSEVFTGEDVQLRTVVDLLMSKLPPRPKPLVTAPTDADYPAAGTVPPAHIEGARPAPAPSITDRP